MQPLCDTAVCAALRIMVKGNTCSIKRFLSGSMARLPRLRLMFLPRPKMLMLYNRCLQLWSCQEAATITFRRAKASR